MLLGDKMKEDEIDGECSTNEGEEKYLLGLDGEFSNKGRMR